MIKNTNLKTIIVIIVTSFSFIKTLEKEGRILRGGRNGDAPTTDANDCRRILRGGRGGKGGTDDNCRRILGDEVYSRILASRIMPGDNTRILRGGGGGNSGSKATKGKKSFISISKLSFFIFSLFLV